LQSQLTLKLESSSSIVLHKIDDISARLELNQVLMRYWTRDWIIKIDIGEIGQFGMAILSQLLTAADDIMPYTLQAERQENDVLASTLV
jgi:hypothetical protein